MSKLTWHNIKIYGAGMLAGMGLYWGAMQHNQNQQLKEKEIPEVNITLGDFNLNHENLGSAHKLDFGELFTVRNKKDNTLVIQAIYQNGEIKAIDLSENKRYHELLNTHKIDSLRRASLNELAKKEWVENYSEHRQNYKTTHKIQCDTLIRTNFGSIYNVSDLTGDGKYDRILYIGKTPGSFDDIRLAKDSTKFYKTLENLMNQK